MRNSQFKTVIDVFIEFIVIHRVQNAHKIDFLFDFNGDKTKTVLNH